MPDKKYETSVISMDSMVWSNSLISRNWFVEPINFWAAVKIRVLNKCS